MSVAGVIGLFRANPQSPVGADGRMALGDHLRELRARVLRVVLLMSVVLVAALFFYDQLFQLILRPYNEAQHTLRGKVTTVPVISGAAAPLLLQLKICGVTAVIVSAPYWLMQIWGFIVPGLHPNEKRWTRTFAWVAGPLFIIGVGIGYYVLPKGLQVLLSFTPKTVTSLLDFNEYFSFMTRMLLIFGVAFEIPLFVVLLNLAGVVSGRWLGAHRPWIIIGTFVFAAVATPSTDPFSMLMLAIPMTLLFFLSEVIARFVDRRRRHRSLAGLGGLDDDEASPLGPDDHDVRRSGLSEDED